MSGWPEAVSDANADRLRWQIDGEIITMIHSNINDGSGKMTGSIGEGMVDMASNPTGDYRVVQIKRAGANLIDMIEQMEVAAKEPGLAAGGRGLKTMAVELIAKGVAKAVEAAVLRDPPVEPKSQAELDAEDDHPQGAAV